MESNRLRFSMRTVAPYFTNTPIEIPTTKAPIASAKYVQNTMPQVRPQGSSQALRRVNPSAFRLFRNTIKIKFVHRHNSAPQNGMK